MASVEQEMYQDAKEQLTKAETASVQACTALAKFEADVDEGLLLKKLRRTRKGLDEEDKREKTMLEERQKRLEKEVSRYRRNVEVFQQQRTQPGNDFVTRALGI